jgi:CRP/FNR family transcriptional regulator, cyclic AMP receptor protein
MALSFNEEVRLLSMVDVLEPLSAEEIEELARWHSDTRLEQGEVFFAPQERGEKLFILEEGRVRIYRNSTSLQGQEITLAVAEEGTIFGEMALTAQRLREAYARALEPSIVVSLKREDLEELILSSPEVGLRLVHLLSERLRQCETLLKDISLKEVPARLANLILRLAESEGVAIREGDTMIPTRYTHEQLGAMIAANRVAVTRAFAELREAGAAEQRRRRVHIIDMEALERAARTERRANQDPE